MTILTLIFHGVEGELNGKHSISQQGDVLLEDHVLAPLPPGIIPSPGDFCVQCSIGKMPILQFIIRMRAFPAQLEIMFPDPKCCVLLCSTRNEIEICCCVKGMKVLGKTFKKALCEHVEPLVCIKICNVQNFINH